MTSRLETSLIRHLVQVFQYSGRAIAQASPHSDHAECERRFIETVMAHTPVAMALADDDLRLLAINPGFEQLYGYSPAVALGANLPILINYEATLAEAMADVRRAVTEGMTHATGRRRRADGSSLEVELVGARVRLCPAHERVVMLYQDITAEKRGREWQQLAEAALESAANAIVVVSRAGEILWVNPAFTRLTGYSAQEAIGQTTRLLKSGRHDPAYYQDLWQRVLAGETWHGETINRRKDGSLYVEDQTIAPVRSDDGQVTHFISIKQDITERKQAQEDLQRAKEAAEAANRAKNTFLANMSHELRTPLNHIIGFAGILAENAQQLGPAGAGFLQDLQYIDTAADQLLALVSDVLDLAKLEVGRVELAPETVEIAPLVQDLATAHGPAADKNSNRLEVRLAPDLGAMHTDPARLRQVLDNLLSNACKFTRGGVITLQAAREPIGRAMWIKFIVADTGQGIQADQLERIFLPFTQVDDSSTRRYGGTGLGLAIVHKFCQLMGGEITVESQVGQGSTFTVLLPAGPAA